MTRLIQEQEQAINMAEEEEEEEEASQPRVRPAPSACGHSQGPRFDPCRRHFLAEGLVSS